MTLRGGTSSVTKEAAGGFPAARLGSVGYVAEINDKRERLIWLEERWLNKHNALRGKGESPSDLIMRLIALEAPRGELKQQHHPVTRLLGPRSA